MTVQAFAEAKATIDPVDIGVGTRALGMGKAYVGLANDANCIFLNPSGLGALKNWGLSSMNSSLISEISYNSIAGYRALSDEAFGAGFVGANITGTIITTYRDPVTNRIVPLDIVAAGYSSNVFLFSYGCRLGKYFQNPYLENTMVGLSLKVFLQSLRSTNETISASGYNMDLGILYPINEYLKFGLYAQNVIGDNFGGSLRWDSGEKELIPSNYKFGLSFKALGETGRWYSDQDLYLNLDLEQGTVTNRPAVYHLGAEWWPYKFLALRTGIDQDVYARVQGNGVDNNLAMGLGFWYGDFGFDYAYHQYGPLTENVTHYFSLSYGYPLSEVAPLRPAEPVVEKKIEKEYIRILSPDDRSVIYEDNVNINGEIIESNVAKIYVNSTEASIVDISDSKRVFNYKMAAIAIGRAPAFIECYDKDGNILRQQTLRIVRFASFLDVPEGYWARNQINTLATLKIFGGYPDGKFKPNNKITRAELASLLVRALGFEVPDVKEDQFSDLKAKHWAAKYVKVAVERGIILGYRDNTFKPNKNLTRTEALLMISRFAGIVPVELLKEKPFPDVPTTHWAAKNIQAAKNEGILAFLADKPFEPNKTLTRAEAAEMLSKTKFAKTRSDGLFE
jgi:hypothetical protein